MNFLLILKVEEDVCLNFMVGYRTGTCIFSQNNGNIEIHFDSDEKWYYGIEGSSPAGQIVFLTVIIHEIGHALEKSPSDLTRFKSLRVYVLYV